MRQTPYKPTEYGVASFKGDHTSYGKNDPISGIWLLIALAPFMLISSCFDCVCQRHHEPGEYRYNYGFPSETELSSIPAASLSSDSAHAESAEAKSPAATSQTVTP